MSLGSSHTSGTAPVIVLTGFMGSGKTVVGRALADMLGVEFIDTDSEIETQTGMTIAQIFEEHGEQHFRNLERQVCTRLAGTTGAVIATGGGMVVDDENRKQLHRLGPVVLLHTDIAVLSRRIAEAPQRPLLSGAYGSQEDLARRIESILQSRASAYGRATMRIDTTDCEPVSAAARIAARLELNTRGLVVNMVPGAAIPPGRFGPARIEIGRGVLCKLGERLSQLGLDSSVFLLMPRNLQALYLSQVSSSLNEAGVSFTLITIKDGDAHKHVTQMTSVIDSLIQAGARRDAVIVPIGGGVTGDIGGFVASAFMRGVALVQVPTTVLAQVDSSIGAKVGVNHPLAKNLIGAFYQPHLILDDPCTFRTLPLEEVSNGMAEVVKSSLIGSEDLFLHLENQLEFDPSTRLRDIGFLEHCVIEAATVKADICNRDPFERGVRQFMNLGHTLGHAIEASGRYEGLKHGQAVSVGLVAALKLALERKRISDDVVRRTIRVLEWCGLPVEFGGFDHNALANAMRLDKKIRRGKLHFVLPTGLGEADVVDDITVDDILEVVRKGAP